MADNEAERLQQEVEMLRGVLSQMVHGQGDKGRRLLRVENLTPDYVTLYHPSGENAKHRTLGPYEVTLTDPAFAESEYVVMSRDRGLIKFEPADAVEDDGRRLVLGETYKLDDPRLEAAALQFLLYPGDDLTNRVSQDKLSATGHNERVMAQILWEFINFTPTPMNIEYLRSTHLRFLQNVIDREKLWRNRKGIIGPIEERISDIRRMDEFGNPRK